MKVTFLYGIGTFANTINGGVYRAGKSGQVSYMRKWVMPRLTENNTKFGSIATNLRLLWSSLGGSWKADLVTYGLRYFSQYLSEGVWDPNKSSYAFYMKLMYAWQKYDEEHVDLEAVTYEDVQALGTPISTIKNCIDNDFLVSIDSYSDLVGAI